MQCHVYALEDVLGHVHEDTKQDAGRELREDGDDRSRHRPPQCGVGKDPPQTDKEDSHSVPNELVRNSSEMVDRAVIIQHKPQSVLCTEEKSDLRRDYKKLVPFPAGIKEKHKQQRKGESEADDREPERDVVPGQRRRVLEDNREPNLPRRQGERPSVPAFYVNFETRKKEAGYAEDERGSCCPPRLDGECRFRKVFDVHCSFERKGQKLGPLQ